MKSALPAAITKVITMRDKTIRLQVDVQEIPPEAMAELFELHDKLGHFFFKEAFFNQIELKDLPPIKFEVGERRPSERLRATLFVLWEQAKIDEPFDNFYRKKIEEYISSIKEKLNP